MQRSLESWFTTGEHTDQIKEINPVSVHESPIIKLSTHEPKKKQSTNHERFPPHTTNFFTSFQRDQKMEIVNPSHLMTGRFYFSQLLLLHAEAVVSGDLFFEKCSWWCIQGHANSRLPKGTAFMSCDVCEQTNNRDNESHTKRLL